MRHCENRLAGCKGVNVKTLRGNFLTIIRGSRYTWEGSCSWLFFCKEVTLYGGSSQAGERDTKATALTQCAFDLNLPPMLLGNALRNGKAQART